MLPFLTCLLSCSIERTLTLLLQSVVQLGACSQLCVLSLAQNQLTTLDGLEGMHSTVPCAGHAAGYCCPLVLLYDPPSLNTLTACSRQTIKPWQRLLAILSL